MELSVTTAPDAARWDAAVAAAGGTIFHTSAWAAYTVAGQPWAQPHYCTLVGDDGRPLGHALAFAMRSRRPVVSAFTGHLWLDSMPVVTPGSGATMDDFVRELEAWARGEKFVEFDIGSFGTPNSPYPLEALGYDTTHRLEFELDLTQPEDVLWEGFEYKRRKNIRKAERLGVEVRDLTGAEGAAALRRVQTASNERILARGGPELSYHAVSARDPVELLLETPYARLVGAFVGGECVSAGLFTFFGGLVYYTASGHERRALDSQAPTRMLWETIKRYRAEGATRFNFGGCRAEAREEGSPEHGVYSYKKAMGGATLDCHSGRKVLRREVYELTGLLRRALQR